jgi:glycosyltransferase involved in cell wall biosynthesis
MAETIAWVVNRLDRIGGGERLLLEGARHYRSLGRRVMIFTWFFDEGALFGGRYENVDIVCLTAKEQPRENILARAWSRARTLLRLRRLLKQHGVSTIFVQGEYDIALVYLATRWLKIAYRFLIFGQIFQYPHDHAKYSLIFCRQLKEIVQSRPGYAATIPLDPPKLSLANKLASEFICLVRYRAVRAAECLFAFSRQIQWETELLFGRSPKLAAGAFDQELLERNHFPKEVLKRHSLRPGRYVLSLSRLDRKKRIDLIIDGFAATGAADYDLVIAGAGGDEAFLRDKAARSGIGDRIKFIGLIDEEDMLPLKHFAALFVSMDIGDYDISPLEALAVGTPALCPTDFDADGNLRAVPGFSLVEATPKTIAAKMSEALANPIRVDRSRMERWSWQSYFDTLLAP